MPPATETLDWNQVCDLEGLSAHWSLQARKRLKPDAVAQQACTQALERLRSNDWQLLRQAYDGRQDPQQFLREQGDQCLREEVCRLADWPQLFFGDDLPAQLAREASRRFGHSPDSESAYNYALDSLSADHWKKLSDSYRGEGSAEGYLRISFLRLLEEYRVRKYGKRRVPEWVKRLGWERIYRLYCLQRLHLEEILNLCSAQSAAADLRAAVREIAARVSDCRKTHGEVTASEEDLRQHSDQESVAAGSGHTLEAAEFETLLQVLRIGLADAAKSDDGSGNAIHSEAQTRQALQEKLDRELRLEHREVLLLRLIYHEGLSIPAAAKNMHPPLHEQTARRLHRSLIQRIRTILQAVGFDAATA